MKNNSFYVVMLFAIIMLLQVIVTAANHARIRQVERQFNSAMEQVSIMEHETIQTEANYDDALNDLYRRVEDHNEIINRIKDRFEYHVNIDREGYDIYTSDGRLIGRSPAGESKTLDAIFINDNL